MLYVWACHIWICAMRLENPFKIFKFYPKNNTCFQKPQKWVVSLCRFHCIGLCCKYMYHLVYENAIISLHNMANFYKILIIDTQYLIHEEKISFHYSDVIMSMMASQNTGASITYLTICSGAFCSKKISKLPVTSGPLCMEFTSDL